MPEDSPKKQMGALTDHTGKRSNIRVVSMASGLTACILCMGTLWGKPMPDLEVLAILLGLPTSLKVWQSISAEQERPS